MKLILKHPFLSLLALILFTLILFFPILALVLLLMPWLINLKKNPPKPFFQTLDEITTTKKPSVQPSSNSNPFMSAKEKQEYLKSSKWKMLKMLKLSKTNNKCESCGSTHNLHLHHNTYKRLGDEKLSDLNILCDKCHNKLHKKLGKNRTTDYPINILRNKL